MQRQKSYATTEDRVKMMKARDSLPVLGPKRRIMYITFGCIFGVFNFLHVTGGYNWMLQGEDMDTIFKTLSIVLPIWFIIDITNLKDNEES